MERARTGLLCRECDRFLPAKAEFCKDHPKAIVDTIVGRSGTPTTPNAKRRRPMVTITFSPEGLATLDKKRKAVPRGAFIESLLGAASSPPGRTK